MTTIQIDDGHPFIFNSGDWVQKPYVGSFNNTLSLSRATGSFKVFRFIGTSIGVYGAVQPTGDSALSASQYSIDNGPARTFAPASPPQVSFVQYYQSQNLTMGEHVLLMTNTRNRGLIWLDYVLIQNTGGNPVLLQSDGSPVPKSPSSPPTSPQSVSSSSPVTDSAVSLVAVPTVAAGIDTALPASVDPLTTHNPMSISIPYISHSGTTSLTSSVVANSQVPVITYQPTIISAQNANALHQKSNNIPAIASSVCGALVFVCLVLAVLVHSKRKQQRRLQTPEDTLQPYTSPMPFSQVFPQEKSSSLETESYEQRSLESAPNVQTQIRVRSDVSGGALPGLPAYAA